VTPRPFALLAELTHRCPLRCPYCSNPTELSRAERELTTAEWSRAFTEAAELGVLHAFLSGGEPLLREDLSQLVVAAHGAGLYTNLITSAYGLDRPKLERLTAAGLDSVQVSLQSDEAPLADAVAGAVAHERKLVACQLVRELGVPLTLNVVVHSGNVDRVGQIIALAEALGAHRLELANVQFYGWAFENHDRLLPTRAQLEGAARVAEAAQERLRGRLEILYVIPDWYADRPKPCMNGWGRRQLTIDPEGRVLPCPTAGAIPGLRFENLREQSLGRIWADSDAFNRFRGTAWLPEPCQSCERRDLDFGGCRCQAALITGDAGATDPACSLSPQREKLLALVARAQGAKAGDFGPELKRLTYRRNP
jgi:pyrroloquinoline quinone biosynthesis protein E